MPVAVEHVDEGGQGEDGDVAGGTYTQASDEDEPWFEDEVGFGEERESEIDENEILRELGEYLEDEFNGELGTA